MNKRSFISLCLVLVFLIAVYFGLKYFFTKSRFIKPVSQKDIALINKIIVETKGSVYTFQKKNDIWKLEGRDNFLVDETSFKEALDSLVNIEIKEVISENPEKFQKFEVTKENGTNIKVFEDFKGKPKQILDVLVGKVAQNYSHSYVKLPNENKIRLAGGIKKYLFENCQSGWRNKTITKFEKENFISCEIEKQSKKYSVAKSSDTVLINGKSVAKEDADSLINSLKNIMAYEYATDEESKDRSKLGFDKPYMKINIVLNTGAAKITVGGSDKDKTKYYTIKESDPTVYLLGSYYLNNITNILEKKPK